MSDSRGGCPLAAVPCSVLGTRRGALHRPGTGWHREVPGPGRREGGGRRIHGRHRTPGLAGLVQPVPAMGSPPVPCGFGCAGLGWWPVTGGARGLLPFCVAVASAVSSSASGGDPARLRGALRHRLPPSFRSSLPPPLLTPGGAAPLRLAQAVRLSCAEVCACSGCPTAAMS